MERSRPEKATYRVEITAELQAYDQLHAKAAIETTLRAAFTNARVDRWSIRPATRIGTQSHESPAQEQLPLCPVCAVPMDRVSAGLWQCPMVKKELERGGAGA